YCLSRSLSPQKEKTPRRSVEKILIASYPTSLFDRADSRDEDCSSAATTPRIQPCVSFLASPTTGQNHLAEPQGKHGLLDFRSGHPHLMPKFYVRLAGISVFSFPLARKPSPPAQSCQPPQTALAFCGGSARDPRLTRLTIVPHSDKTWTFGSIAILVGGLLQGFPLQGC